MYTALELSKYVVSKCIDNGSPITNLQLQKILYYIQKNFLSRNTVAFPDDIEAWQFGPVVPNVYYYFCGYGAMPIFLPVKAGVIDTNDAVYIDRIVESKRVLNPWDLVEETHKPGGAWEQVYNNGVGNHHVIPVALIKAVG